MVAARRRRSPSKTPSSETTLRRLFHAWVRREGARLVAALEATHCRALAASAREAAREYFDQAWAQTHCFVHEPAGWRHVTDPRAIVAIIEDPANVSGRDYLFITAAPVMIIEVHGELRMMTEADLLQRIAELEQAGDALPLGGGPGSTRL